NFVTMDLSECIFVWAPMVQGGPNATTTGLSSHLFLYLTFVAQGIEVLPGYILKTYRRISDLL
ncbi:unnamed protein product, partial [Heterotrigona itama]